MSDDTPGYVPPSQEPEFLPNRANRTITFAGIVQRVLDEFEIEYGDQAPALLAADTPVKKRSLVREVADYVFAVESLQLSSSDRARVMARVFSERFGYGPLDDLLADTDITTITLEGRDKVALRYGPGADLTPVPPVFEDMHHMKRIIERLLRDAGANLHPDLPIIETGLMVNGRPISLSVTVPPFAPELSVDMRLHPVGPLSLDDFVSQGIFDVRIAVLLEAIAKSEHGFMIVGDTESGKTSLLGAMLGCLPVDTALATVERAGELAFLPDAAQRHQVRWPSGDQVVVSFGALVPEALAGAPKVLVLDEVRHDEPAAIVPLLGDADVPRLIWAFRGASEPKRLRAALGVVARQALPAAPEAAVQRLYARLPFVVVLKRRKGGLSLMQVAEWQSATGDSYADLVVLGQSIAGEHTDWQLTGQAPSRDLPLAPDYWQK